MITVIILLLIWILGCNIAFWMLLTEHKAEDLLVTNGDTVVCFLLSILSWFTVGWLLVSSWVERIRVTGYWNKPVEKTQDEVNNKLKKAS